MWVLVPERPARVIGIFFCAKRIYSLRAVKSPSRSLLLVFATTTLFAACGPQEPPPKDPQTPIVTASPSTTATATETPVTKKPADLEIEAFMARLLNEYLERQPVRATEAGDHRFDGTWNDPSKA